MKAYKPWQVKFVVLYMMIKRSVFFYNVIKNTSLVIGDTLTIEYTIVITSSKSSNGKLYHVELVPLCA